MEARTKKSLVIWGIVLLVLLNISSLGTIWYNRYQVKSKKLTRVNREWPDQQMKSRIDRRTGAPHTYITKDLNLSEGQQKEFDTIWQRHFQERRAIEAELGKTRLEMGKVLNQDNIDSITFFALSESQAKLMQELNYTMLKMNKDLRVVLSEEQKDKFLKRLEKMNDRRRSRDPERQRRE